MRHKRKFKPWVHTVGADWSHQPEAVRRSVEDLLEWLAQPKHEHRPDYDAPIGHFVTTRKVKRQGQRRRPGKW